MRRRATLSTLFFSVCLSTTPAAIVTYNFAGQPGNQATTPVTTGVANLTEGAIARGSGLNASAAADSMSSDGFTTGNSIDANDYYTISLLADLGFTFDLSQMIFAERRSGTGIRNIEVRTSADSFAAAVFSATVPDDTSTRQQTVNFTGFTGLSSLEVRIYGFGAEAGGGTWRLGSTSTIPSTLTFDVTVNPAVPEPSTYLLTGTALILAGTLRSRRSK